MNSLSRPQAYLGAHSVAPLKIFPPDSMPPRPTARCGIPAPASRRTGAQGKDPCLDEPPSFKVRASRGAHRRLMQAATVDVLSCAAYFEGSPDSSGILSSKLS